MQIELLLDINLIKFIVKLILNSSKYLSNPLINFP